MSLESRRKRRWDEEGSGAGRSPRAGQRKTQSPPPGSAVISHGPSGCDSSLSSRSPSQSKQPIVSSLQLQVTSQRNPSSIKYHLNGAAHELATGESLTATILRSLMSTLPRCGKRVHRTSRDWTVGGRFCFDSELRLGRVSPPARVFVARSEIHEKRRSCRIGCGRAGRRLITPSRFTKNFETEWRTWHAEHFDIFSSPDPSAPPSVSKPKQPPVPHE